MSYELTGKLVAKYDTVQRTETFKTREFAVEKTDDIGGRTVTNYVKFQSVQDKTSIIDKVNIGDEIKVLFNIKGSKWEKDGKVNYITNLDAWRIEQVLQTPADKTGIDNEYMEPLDTFSSTSPDAIDDLPFLKVSTDVCGIDRKVFCFDLTYKSGILRLAKRALDNFF